MKTSFSILMLTTLFGLTLAATSPVVRAQQTITNSVTSRNTYTLTPFNLAHLAYQGRFRAQGIPGYSAFKSAYLSGRIDAKSLVQSAVKANLIPEKTLAEYSYISATEDQLRALTAD